MDFSRLTDPRHYRLGLLAALLVGLPTLCFGFFVDDYLHLMTIEGADTVATPLELFTFANGNPEEVLPYIERGPYPWFMDLEFKARLFRPLSSLLMTLDRALFGRCAVAYHLHSLGWYLLLALGAMLILRRTFSPATGILVLLLFVVDESHTFPAAWWSNRNAITAVALGFLGIAAHLRWREDRWNWGLPLSLAAFSGALLSGEVGLSTLAYVLSYECLGSQDTPARRFWGVLPASLLAISYFSLYHYFGFGSKYSDLYLDPGTAPLAYLASAPARFIILSGSHFLNIPCEPLLLFPALTPLYVILGAVSIALAFWGYFKIQPKLDSRERIALRWILPGAAMAAAPSLAALVSTRMLLAPSLGGMALIAVIIRHGWRAETTGKALRLLAGVFIVLHLLVAALSWPVQVAALRHVGGILDNQLRTIPLEETGIETAHILMLNAPDPYTGMYALMVRHFDGLPRPRAWWILSMAPYSHRLTRTGPRELELEIIDGQMMEFGFETLVRSKNRPLKKGDFRDLKGLKITVLEAGDRGPRRLGLEFSEDPEGGHYQFIGDINGTFQRIAPPPVGETVELHR